MNLRLPLLAVILFAGILISAACDSDAPTLPPDKESAATPDVSATITAQVQSAGLGQPMPTEVSDRAQAAVLEFAASLGDIYADWDQFHAGYDAWRQGLAACTAGSFRSSLRGFAGRFTEVTEAARSLPRHPAVRGLADTLIEAAELEEEALRYLRDTWQPDSVLITQVAVPDEPVFHSEEVSGSQVQFTASAFELVDQARAASLTLRQEVADALVDRAVNTSKASLASIDKFARTFSSIDAQWDDFHRQYDAFRNERWRTPFAEAENQLGRLIIQFQDVVIAIRQLPITAPTGPIADTLAQAAQQEDLALRQLRDTFQFLGDPAAGGTGESLPPAFDTQLVEVNTKRLEARRMLEEVLEEISAETQAEVRNFAGPYNQLLEDWDGFHIEYIEWRNTEGGCDRARATRTLGQLNASFGDISRAVRGLPPATVLRPLAEILVEAAEREERALRGLLGTWRPNDPEVYQDFDLQRSTASKLRRQVTTGLQDLLESYGVSP